MCRIFFIGLVIALMSCSTKEEKIKEAEEDGKFLVEENSSFVKGVGEALSEDGKEAAEKVSEGVGNVFKGLNKGFDKSLTKIEVKTNEEIDSLLELGRSGQHFNDSTLKTDIVIYAIFQKDFKGTLVLKAFDGDDAELGRKSFQADNKAEDAGYISFEFDERTPLNLAEYFTVEIKK